MTTSILLNIKLTVSYTDYQTVSTGSSYVSRTVDNLSNRNYFITYINSGKTILKTYDKYGLELASYEFGFTYSERAKVFYLNTQKLLIADYIFYIISLNQDDLNQGNYKQIQMKDVTSSSTIRTAVATLSDGSFAIGLVNSNAGIIQKYSSSAEFVSSQTITISGNYFDCISLLDIKIACFYYNPNDFSLTYVNIYPSNLGPPLNSQKISDSNSTPKGHFLFYLDDSHEKILLTYRKDDNSLMVKVLEFSTSSNTFTNYAPGTGSFSALTECVDIRYTDAFIMESGYFMVICKSSSSSNSYNFAKIQYQNIKCTTILTNTFDMEKEVNNVNLIFMGDKHIGFFFNDNANLYFTTVYQPHCKDINYFYINNNNTHSLTFKISSYVNNGLNDNAGGTHLFFISTYNLTLTYGGKSIITNVNYAIDSNFYFSLSSKGIYKAIYEVKHENEGGAHHCWIQVHIKCYEGCNTCQTNGTSPSSMNCRSCDNDNQYYKIIDEPNTDFNCYKELDGYYLNGNFLKHCFTNCKKCSGGGTDQDMKCTSCIANYYPLFDNDSMCYQSPINYYYLDPTNVFMPCSTGCLTCNTQGNSTHTKCLSCDTGYYSLEGETSPFNCLQQQEIIGYFINSNNKLEKCDDSCYRCVTLRDNCIACSNNYYYSSDNNSNCYNDSTKPIGTYFSNDTNKYERCYETCATCTKEGNPLTHNCDSCITSRIPNPIKKNNCIVKCSANYWYLSDDLVFTCTSGYRCPSSRPILIDEVDPIYGQQCVENCKDIGTCLLCRSKSLYLYNNKCVENCPTNTTAILGEHVCIEKDNCRTEKYSSDISLSQLSDNIDSIALNYSKMYLNTDKQVVIINDNDDKYKLMIFKLEECTYNITEDLTKLNLANCPNTLRLKYIIPNTESLIILKADISFTNRTTNQLAYAFYMNNGTKLNLSYCSEETIDVSYPILDPEKINYELAYNMSLKGIDIYNSSDPFFTDVCYPFTSEEGEDVSLEDRKKRYYQNAELCEDGCRYNGINYTNTEVNCKCVVKSSFITEALNNSLTSEVLEIINSAYIEFFTCYKNLFNVDNMVKNIGSWTTIGFFVTIFAFFVAYLCQGLVNIKIYLLQFMKQVPNPPKKNEGNNKEEGRFNPKYFYQSPHPFVISDLDNEQNNYLYSQSVQFDSPASLIQTDTLLKRNMENIHLNSRKPLNNAEINIVKLPIVNSDEIEEKYTNAALKIINPNCQPIQIKKKKEFPVKKVEKTEKTEKTNSFLLEKNTISYKFSNYTKEKNSGISLIPEIEQQTEQSNKEKESSKKIKYQKKYEIKLKNRPQKKFNNPMEKIAKQRGSLSGSSTEKGLRSMEKPKIPENVLELEENNDFTDEEINELCVEDARKYDNRHFCLFYWQMLKIRQDIINTFFNNNPLESFPIKCILFIFSISLYFFVNALFFQESYISTHLHKKSRIVFVELLQSETARCIYSGLVSMVCALISNFISGPRKRIETLIKKMKNTDKFAENAYEIVQRMKKINTIFIVIVFILLLVFWYYISIFCIVKYNSRINWIEGSLITLAITNVLPFITSGLIAILRYAGMRCTWLGGLYKLSQCITEI